MRRSFDEVWKLNLQMWLIAQMKAYTMPMKKCTLLCGPFHLRRLFSKTLMCESTYALCSTCHWSKIQPSKSGVPQVGQVSLYLLNCFNNLFSEFTKGIIALPDLVNSKWKIMRPQLQKCPPFSPSWLLMVEFCLSDMWEGYQGIQDQGNRWVQVICQKLATHFKTR